ncbi:uncharacterized protein VTP21DRAFT_9966 [Calcarisporiella thermophila]|uniref:uncharacterized protein n=1 Tax=Calcarisporiella thermophila TaxID=911321 RepID=UPI0037424FDE
MSKLVPIAYITSILRDLKLMKINDIFPVLQRSLGSLSPRKILLLYLLYLIVKYPNRAIGSRRYSGKGATVVTEFPLLGSFPVLFWFRHSILELMLWSRRRYGPCFTLTFPLFPRIFVITDPQLIEHVLKGSFEDFEKGYELSKRLRPLLGNGIFNCDGDRWRRQRKTASHVFNVKNFRELTTGIFREESKLVVKVLEQYAESGQEFNLSDVFFRFTLDTFGKLSFGTSFNCLERPQDPIPFAVAFDQAQTIVDMRFKNVFYQVSELLTGAKERLQRATKVVDEYAYQVIESRRQEIRDRGAEKTRKKDLLDMFIDYRDENGKGLSDAELRDVVINFMLAGRDTTAQQLSWQYLMMMRHPDIQQRAREELQQFDPDEIDYDTLRSLHYCLSLFNETLRLYPSVPRNAKFAVKDSVLPNGALVKKGDAVAFSPYVLGRLTEVWGPDAEQFNPERWLERDAVGNVVGVKRESPSKFPAFHAGPRTCLGQTFATLESLLLTSQLLTRFEFTLSPTFIERERRATEPLYAPSLTMPMRRPLLVKVRKL